MFKEIECQVKWGDLRIGCQARPEFTLLLSPSCPKPTVVLHVDEKLDDHPDLFAPVMVHNQGEGKWIFDTHFCLTTEGADCAPGSYKISLKVALISPCDNISHVYESVLKIEVGNSSGGKTLEISGGDDSLVNLQGLDFDQFNTVKLSASGATALNLHKAENLLKTGLEKKSGKVAKYMLRCCDDLAEWVPSNVLICSNSENYGKISLNLSNGNRILLASLSGCTFGRNKDADVVLRLFPRNAENDELTMSISRYHFSAELRPHGMEFRGTREGAILLNGLANRVDPVVAECNGYTQKLRVALIGPNPKVGALMNLECTLYPGPNGILKEKEFDKDIILNSILGTKMDKLQELAWKSGIDASRFRRVGNTADEEYVIVYRSGVVGKNPENCPVCLPGMAGKVLFRHDCFWMQTDMDISVCGLELESGTLFPLLPGMLVATKNNSFVVGQWAQKNLDDGNKIEKKNIVLNGVGGGIIKENDIEIKSLIWKNKKNGDHKTKNICESDRLKKEDLYLPPPIPISES